MSAEFPTETPKQPLALDEDVVIEADAILAEAKMYHEALMKLVDEIPAERIDEVGGLSVIFDNAYKSVTDAYDKLHSGGEIGVQLDELRKSVLILHNNKSAFQKLLAELDTAPSEDLSKNESATIDAGSTEVSIPKVETVEVKSVALTNQSPARKPEKLQDQHVKDRLVEQLFDNESHDFLLTDAPSGQRRKKKKIADLREDVKSVFATKGVSAKAATGFLNTQFRTQQEEISNLVKLLNTEVDKNKIAEYHNRINAAYEQIRTDVIAEVMTAQARCDERQKNLEEGPSLLQRDIEAVKDDIDTARFYLSELQNRHKDTEGFLSSDEYKNVAHILELADNCNDADSNVLNQKLEKYLTGLWPALDVLTIKFTVGTGVESVDVPEHNNESGQEFLDGAEVTKLDKVPDNQEIKVASSLPMQPDINLDELAPQAPTESGVDLPQEPGPKSERELQRYKSLEAKQRFREDRKNYLEALEVHQKEMNNRSMFEKMRSLGMKPKLPDALEALEKNYLGRRQQYAKELDARLSQRGEKFTLSQDDMKRAFARKFILRPHDELLKLQERTFLSPEASRVLQSVAGKLGKNKWAIRAGVVVVAGTVGALSGGTALAFAGAAGWQGAKIAGAATFGAYAGSIAHGRTQEYVDVKQKELSSTKDNIEKNFSIESMFVSGEDLIKPTEAEAKARKIQKVATVAASGVAGFAAGYGMAENVPDSINALTNPGTIATELSQLDGADLQTSQIIPQVVETAEVPTETVFIEEIAIPFNGREGGLVYEHHVSDVSFGSEFNSAALNEADNKALSSFVRVKIDDILVKPNTPVSVIETELQAAIEKKFGSASWWTESPIKSVDIGKVEVVLVPGNETAAVAEAAAEVALGEYTVEKGDTLWKITETKFADQLKHLTPSERNEVLDRLFDRVRENPEVLESLSLKSGDNIDKIYAGEQIELDGLQAELAKVLETREIVESFKNSAPLTVEADQAIKSVPITVVEKPIPGGTEVLINNERSYTEAAQGNKTIPTSVVEKPIPGGTEVLINNERSYTEAAKIEPVITPEITTSTNSFYEAAPQHVRDEIRQYFSNPKAFEIAVERAADKIDARAYDFFDSLSNNYESPYNLLRDMRVSAYAQLQEMPSSQLRAFLTDNNIKYEAFLEWQDKIKELQNNIPHTKTDTIGAMFEQSVFQDKVTETANPNVYIN